MNNSLMNNHFVVKAVNKVMKKESNGMIDCWMAQDVALERASTAGEVVKIMGDFIEKYGWHDNVEAINVTDDDELWIVEFYGRDIWAAKRVPDGHFFVAARRARIDMSMMKIIICVYPI
ncbi:dipeptidase [Sporohalobacter salinus]|nr:dipeptidase [Sporohalobacter salinus]